MVRYKFQTEIFADIVWDFDATAKLQDRILGVLIMRENLPELLRSTDITQVNLAELEISWVNVGLCFLSALAEPLLGLGLLLGLCIPGAWACCSSELGHCC
ncbi:MAG: hypothetical protein ACKPKO_12840, partial [Candidatus Fonsibacter sp.]